MKLLVEGESDGLEECFRRIEAINTNRKHKNALKFATYKYGQQDFLSASPNRSQPPSGDIRNVINYSLGTSSSAISIRAKQRFFSTNAKKQKRSLLVNKEVGSKLSQIVVRPRKQQEVFNSPAYLQWVQLSRSADVRISVQSSAAVRFCL